MKRNSCLIIFYTMLFVGIRPSDADAQPENQIKVLPKWESHGSSSNALYHHLLDESADLLSRRREKVADIGTLEEWKARQREGSAKLAERLGSFPEKTPLNARVTRTIVKKTFKVEHIVFESRPGFMVTSSLFIPRGAKKIRTAPAIIYCSGHTAEGYRSSTYQSILLNLVNKGFVVFAFDPVGQGERLEYVDAGTGKSTVGGPTRQHALPGAQVFLTGHSLASYMIWDGIRAVDYLLTRSEVDPARIGITGRSGGGTQSSFIAALDPRIYAAAPEGYITGFSRLLESIGPQDAEQNIPGAIAEGLDHADLLTVRAPKPAMMITTTNDFFSIQGAKETEAEVARIYEAYGNPGNFSRVEDVAPHSSTRKNREAMYAFFQKHLRNPGSPVDEDLELLTAEEIMVTETGMLATSALGSETTFSLNRKIASDMEAVRDAARENDPHDPEKVVAAARELSGYQPPEDVGEPVLTGLIHREGYKFEKYFLQGEGDYVIPYLKFVPQQPSGKMLIYLHAKGKGAEAHTGGNIEEFVKAGYTVFAPDLIGQGEMGRGLFGEDNYFPHAPNTGLTYIASNWGVLIDRSIVGIRAGDLVRLIQMIKRQDPGAEVYAVAIGKIAPVLLHAAAFEKGLSGIALVEPLGSYASIANEQFYDPELIEHTVPGSLAHYDLPDLAASLAPAKLALFNATDATGRKFDAKSGDSVFAVVKNAYAEKDAENNLKIDIRESAFTPSEVSEFIE